MKSESEFKSSFKRSVSHHKGASISLAAPVLPGIPDLYIILPNYMPVLLEAKWLGSIPRTKFKRKIQYSPMQLSYANRLNTVQPYAMMGLIGLIYNKKTYAVLTPINPTENYLESTFFEDYNKVARQEGRFDVQSLFAGSSIPLLDTTPITGLTPDELIERTVGITDVIRGADTEVIGAEIDGFPDLSELALSRQIAKSRTN